MQIVTIYLTKLSNSIAKTSGGFSLRFKPDTYQHNDIFVPMLDLSMNEELFIT